MYCGCAKVVEDRSLSAHGKRDIEFCRTRWVDKTNAPHVSMHACIAGKYGGYSQCSSVSSSIRLVDLLATVGNTAFQ